MRRQDDGADTIAMKEERKPPPGESALPRLWRLATTDGLPRSSLRVALVVGSVLNLINQGDALVGAAPVNWFKIVLTFFVPYGVSTYGAVAARLRAEASAPPMGSPSA